MPDLLDHLGEIMHKIHGRLDMDTMAALGIQEPLYAVWDMEGRPKLRDGEVTSADWVAFLRKEAAGSMPDRLKALADELLAPMVCTAPGGGGPVPGQHCAACCYGTGYIVTCDEDQIVADTADAMRSLARLLEPDGSEVDLNELLAPGPSDGT